MTQPMADTLDVQVAARGIITLPRPLRDAYGIKQGDRLTLLDLGGVFVLSRREPRVDALANLVAERLQAEGENIESMLVAIREERAKYDA